MAGFWDRVLGRAETKESATGRIMVMTPGQPVWSNRDYKAFSDEAYRRNVVAFRCIQAIADAVSSVPWTVWRGKQELTTHPLLDLIRKPNPRDSGSQYLHQKVGYLMLSGNSYEEYVLGSGGQVVEMYQLRPDRMKIIPSETGFPRAYEYSIGQRKVRFDIDPNNMQGLIRHLKTFNPTDDWYGMSPIEAGAYAVDTHNEAGAWIQSLLQKSARPSGAMTFKDGDKTLSDEEFNRLKTQIDEQYGGASNAGRPMLLEGGLDWKQMGLSPVDMAIIETKLSAARDIALAFGVPPQLLGIPGDNTYANYQEARLAFWEDTVIPLVGMIADDWNASLSEPFGVTIKADFDQIPAIVEKKRAQWEMLDKTQSLTLNEKREAMGYEPVPNGDDIMVPFSSMPLSASGVTPEDITDAKALAYGLQTK